MARLPDPARSRAVLIGTGSYTAPELPGLPGVPNNLDDLRALLTSSRGTGMPEASCSVLPDPPDAATVGLRLAEAAADAEDLLLVYYAGHGLIGTGNELFFALGNTNPAIVGMSALRCAEVRQAFLTSAATIRVLIVDCCFSGRAFEQTMSNTASPADALLSAVDVHGAYVLTATQPNQLALAPDGQRNTLFTGELLRILRDGIPDGPELLTLDVLYQHLKASLGRRNLPLPSCNTSEAAAHLALCRNPTHRAARTGDIARLHHQIASLEALERDYPSRVEALRAAIDELATAETATHELFLTVRDKIANPGLPRLKDDHAPQLRHQLSGIHDLAHDGRWSQVADQLARLDREVSEAMEGTRRLRTLLAGPLDRREELRGRLRAFHPRAVREGRAEDKTGLDLYELAHNLLWTKPCDLPAATRAVEAYLTWLRDAREGGGR